MREWTGEAYDWYLNNMKKTGGWLVLFIINGQFSINYRGAMTDIYKPSAILVEGFVCQNEKNVYNIYRLALYRYEEVFI